MPAVEESTMALPLVVQYRPTPQRGPRDHRPAKQRPPRPGTAVYHCYRYASDSDPVPAYADGTAPGHLPTDARGWRLTPWRDYEDTAEFDADAATSWLTTQIRGTAAGHPGHVVDQRVVDAASAGCTAALNSLASAYQTTINLPGGNVLALAVVAIWDPAVIHPRLQLGGWS